LDQSAWKDSNALRRLIEYYKDLAFPTAALIFCILGVPVGIVSKRSGRIGGFSVGVVIFIFFFFLYVTFEFFFPAPSFPPFAGAWMPNTVFLAITIWWFYVMSRK